MAPPRPGKKGKASGKGKAPASSAQADLPDAILEEIPDPIATLNLGDPEKIAASYEKCVTDIIEFIKTKSGKGFTFTVEGDHEHKLDRYLPLTPGVDESPTGAYTIAITDGTKTLRLVTQKYQTWFRGFVTDSGDRYEIDGMTPKMMVGSRSLHTFSRYYVMFGTTADQCRVGYHLITDAFHTLVAHPNSTGDSDGAIAIILVMLYEAPRFPAVYQKCMQFIREMKNDYFVGENLQQLINSWCRKCLNFYKENQEQETVVLTEESSTVIKEIAQEFSILCRSAWDRWLEENGKEDTRGGGGGGSKPKKTVGTSGSSHSK